MCVLAACLQHETLPRSSSNKVKNVLFPALAAWLGPDATLDSSSGLCCLAAKCQLTKDKNQTQQIKKILLSCH